MKTSPLGARIAEAQHRLDALLQQAGVAPDQQVVLNQALAELATTLEELHVSAEELHRHEELAAAGAALQVERARYHELFEFAPDAYVVTDVAALIEEANAAAERLLHRDRQFLIGKPWPVFVAAEDRLRFRAQLDLLRNGVTARLEDWEVRLQPAPDSTAFPAALTVAPVKSGNEPIRGFRWLIRDITERKRIEDALRTQEAQLRHAQKLEAVGRLAGGLAHDINNQLTVIKGSVQFALASLSPDHPCRRDLDRIGETVERSAALVRRLLTFSRSLPLAMAPLNLASVLQEMTPLLRLLLGEQISLEVHIAPDLGLVRADRGAIEQVVMNLVTNARDAIAPHPTSEPGGSIRVELDKQLFPPAAAIAAALPPGAYVCLTVTDNGRGMSPDVQEHIFEPFFTTKEPGKGTGLGLATTFGVVQQHRGYITCASTVGQGSTFQVYLPRDDGQPREDVLVTAPAALHSRATAPGATILLVEDEATVREVVERALEDAGYRVYSAAHAAEALQIAATIEGPIDLLVTDVVMPGIGGPMLAEQMGQAHPELAVIFMSGYTPDTTQLSASPNKRFLSKPFDIRHLLDAVAKLVQPPSP